MENIILLKRALAQGSCIASVHQKESNSLVKKSLKYLMSGLRNPPKSKRHKHSQRQIQLTPFMVNNLKNNTFLTYRKWIKFLLIPERPLYCMLIIVPLQDPGKRPWES